jgi:polyketide biosynthesis 3-hydroxy-3-methylglutaryl-CoA synthase-like enzyme PksG
MVLVGIEALNVFGGSVFVEVEQLARSRHLNVARFENLLMKQKTVVMPWEDPVSFAVNAARPILSSLSQQERDRIELLITCSESGIDFGKSLSTYVHRYLELNRNCRLFEIKQACYAGTAGFQMACNFLLSQTSPGAKALVISTDISRMVPQLGTDALQDDGSYAELSSGAGAVAMLIGEDPSIFQLDVGASGYYGYEVMDTCRPTADYGAGDPDLSLLSYLDCCEQAFLEYQRRVPNADYANSFDYLAFHTPFGGMVKGAHRAMMRKIARATSTEIEADFERRVVPGMEYCQRIGNVMSGTIFVSMASTIDQGRFPSARRIGCFSYGSGCCSEFYSGVVGPEAQQRLRKLEISKHLDERHPLSIAEYEEVLRSNSAVRFGTRNFTSNGLSCQRPKSPTSYSQLALTRIVDFHREYEWME